MPALNFKPAFAPMIEVGAKILTMRQARKDDRDPAPIGAASPLRLYTGMRRPECRLVLETRTVFRCGLQFGEVGPVALIAAKLAEGGEAVAALLDRALHRQSGSLDALARADGFDDWTALWAFHSAAGLDGIGCVYREVIGWRPPVIQ